MSNIGRELYRKSIEGEVSYWSIQFSEHRGYLLIYGSVYGSLVTKVLNETMPRIENRYLAKLNDGYVMKPLDVDVKEFIATLKDVRMDSNNRRKPMKAQPYRPGCMQLPAILQGKINGGRCTAEWVEEKGGDLFDPDYEGFALFSKEGHRLDVPNIVNYLNEVAKYRPEIKSRRFDGEVFAPNVKVASINGAARNRNNPINARLMFIAFDLSEDGEQLKRTEKLNIAPFSKLFIDRDINTEVTTFISKDVYVCQLSSTWIYNESDIAEARDKAIANNYEGIILRDPKALYGFGKRVKTMRKFKKELFGDFEILNIYPRNADDGLPMFLLKNDLNDGTFESSCNGTHPQQRKVLATKSDYIGKKISVKYFERTDLNLPFHTTVLITDFDNE